MKVEKHFVSNYLSQRKHQNGKESAIIVLLMCLLASWTYWNPELIFSKKLSASYLSVFSENEYWRLLTTSFVHADLKHLLSNSFMLSILIFFVSSFFGPIVSIVLSFVVAIFTNLIVLQVYGESSSLVGASGVVFYLWGFWIIQYMFIQRQLSLINRLLRMGTVFLILLIPSEYHPNTSYLAHYFGFFIGLIVGSIYFVLYRKSLLSYESWEHIVESSELSELDKIALNYPIETEVTRIEE